MARGKKNRPKPGAAPAALSQTEGGTPGMRKRTVPVRGAIVPRRELKYSDIASTTYALDTTGSVTLLNGIAENDDNTNRTGRQAMMRGVGVAGFAGVLAGATTIQRGRVLLVWDNAINGALPAVTDILSAATANSFHKVDNESRFTVLADIPLVFGPNVTTATQAYVDQSVRAVDVFVPLSSVTQYIGTGATIASVGNGGLLLVTVGTQGAGATAAFANLATRVRFSDED